VHTRVLLGYAIDYLVGSIAAVVVNNENLVLDAGRIERCAYALQQGRNVLGLAQGGNCQRQTR